MTRNINVNVGDNIEVYVVLSYGSSSGNISTLRINDGDIDTTVVAGSNPSCYVKTATFVVSDDVDIYFSCAMNGGGASKHHY